MRLKMRIRFVCYTIQKSTVLKIGKNTQWNPHPNVLQCRILSECSGSATLTDPDTYEIYFTPPPPSPPPHPGPVVLNSCEGSIYIRVLSLIIFSTVGECIFHVGGGELCKNAFPRISKVLASTRKMGTRLTIQSFSFLSAFFFQGIIIAFRDIYMEQIYMYLLKWTVSRDLRPSFGQKIYPGPI